MLKPKVLDLYIDGIDWRHHLDEDARGNHFYYSLKSILKYEACATHCGVIKVRATLANPEWVHNPSPDYGTSEDKEVGKARRVASYEAKVEALKKDLAKYQEILDRVRNEPADLYG